MAGVKSIFSALLQLTVLGFCISQKFSGDSCITSDQRNGTCKPIDQCQTAAEELRMNQRPSICSFEGSNPIVCCVNTDNGASPVAAANQLKPGEKAEEWCRWYKRLCSKRRLIAGGEKATFSEFPHMAAIGYGEEDKIRWMCGGSLITDTYVLSAAHCAHTAVGLPRWVLLGTGSLTSGHGLLYPIIRIILHPEYKAPSKYHDLALLELGDPIPPKDEKIPVVVRPACLPSLSFNHSATEAIATGWGSTGFGEEGSTDLLKVKLDILDTALCNQSFEVEIRTTKLLSRGIDNQMLCAGVLGGGRDTCAGDSGGPLLSPKREECMFVVLGITSFGKLCAFANSPAVYVRVSEYIPWIESVIP